MINKGNKIKARKGGKVSVSEDVAKNASKIKARTGGEITIVNPTDTCIQNGHCKSSCF